MSGPATYIFMFLRLQDLFVLLYAEVLGLCLSPQYAFYLDTPVLEGSFVHPLSLYIDPMDSPL